MLISVNCLDSILLYIHSISCLFMPYMLQTSQVKTKDKQHEKEKHTSQLRIKEKENEREKCNKDKTRIPERKASEGKTSLKQSSCKVTKDTPQMKAIKETLRKNERYTNLLFLFNKALCMR